MKFTNEISAKINDAWQYNSASTCIWATTEMDKFVIAILNGNSIEIEEDNLIIENLVDFMHWKNKKWIFSQISILEKMAKKEKIDLLNQMISDYKISKLKFEETDPNNHYFSLTLINDAGKFKIHLGKISNMDMIPAYTIDVKQIQLNETKLSCLFTDDLYREFEYEKIEIK